MNKRLVLLCLFSTSLGRIKNFHRPILLFFLFLFYLSRSHSAFISIFLSVPSCNFLGSLCIFIHPRFFGLHLSSYVYSWTIYSGLCMHMCLYHQRWRKSGKERKDIFQRVIQLSFPFNKHKKVLGLLYVSSKYGPILPPAIHMSEWNAYILYKWRTTRRCNGQTHTA